MDPPALINDGSFGSGNANSYNLAQIWEYPTDAGGDVGEASDGFGMRDEAVEDSMGVDQGGSQGSSGRKRRDAPAAQEDESAEIVSASGGNDMNNGNGRRLKTRKSRAEIRDSKAEGEASSGKGIEQNLQPLEPLKQDYIHVRARRGEATDSHSLAERGRREKISERMKILQDLVPTCNKVIGKAVVLDEIINYIQSLQCQVEFLSMKLEAVNSRMRPSIEAFP